MQHDHHLPEIGYTEKSNRVNEDCHANAPADPLAPHASCNRPGVECSSDVSKSENQNQQEKDER
jgi:hypothetical protein